jgi:hypothetical protein
VSLLLERFDKISGLSNRVLAVVEDDEDRLVRQILDNLGDDVV